MTRDQIAGKVAQNLYDVGMVQFDADNLNDSVQDGYDEVALLTNCIEKVTTVNFQSNITYYNLRTLVTDYYRPVAIYNPNTKRWMAPTAFRDMREFHPRWETVNGEEAFFSPLGFEYIVFFRKQTTASGNFYIFYSATADTLTGATTPQIPIEYHKVLENYATADMLDQNLEYTKAMKYYNAYIADLDRIKNLVRNRNWPDRLYVLAAEEGLIIR